MPSPYITSNSASRNGGATLFFTTFTRVRPPTTASPSLMLRDAADVDAHRRVELQRAAAGRRFRIAEHHADLLAQLVDEDEARLRLRDDAGELAQRLRHQPRLQAHLRFAHLAFDFRRGTSAATESTTTTSTPFERIEHFDDLERLLAVVGLRDEQVVEVDAELLRVLRVERVLGVDERRHAAELLRLGDDLQRQRRLARRFRAEDLDDAAARHAADAERVVDADRAGGDGVDRRESASFWPRRMIEPLPNCFSIWPTASSTAFSALAVVTVVWHIAPSLSGRWSKVDGRSSGWNRCILESCPGGVKRK